MFCHNDKKINRFLIPLGTELNFQYENVPHGLGMNKVGQDINQPTNPHTP